MSQCGGASLAPLGRTNFVYFHAATATCGTVIVNGLWCSKACSRRPTIVLYFGLWVMEGKLLCRDCLLKEEYGYHGMCPTRGHHGSLQTRDGKIWQILDGEASEELIHNSKLLGRTVRIHGRCFRRASSIEVDSYEIL